MNWIIMPVLAGPEMTEAAVADCLAQSVPTRLLIINQGVDTDFRDRLERLAEEYQDRILLWNHEPPLPSLSASWNRALDFVWQSGGEEALVVNNDVRLRPDTVSMLSTVLDQTVSYFVTAVGVTKDQWGASLTEPGIDLVGDLSQRGGPDFSCFLISKVCHDKYRFDEAIIPSHTEDLDYHRRLMLGGDGDKIFSVNLPYYHIAAGTLKSLSPEKRQRLERQIDGARAYYARKWGGSGVNDERFTIPFDASSERDGVTTPELQEQQRANA